VRTVNVFLVGTGLIGGTLLAQIARATEGILKEDRAIRINVMGIANSKKMLIGDGPIEINRWKELLEKGAPSDLGAFVAEMKRRNLPSACFCDCTASEAPSAYYADILSSSISIVTPNKKERMQGRSIAI